MSNNILVTGAAGFIGFHVCEKLIKEDFNIIGFDNVNNYYDQKIKEGRLQILEKEGIKKRNWSFFKGDLEDIRLIK